MSILFIFIGTKAMPSIQHQQPQKAALPTLKQLEQEKAELELKIAQSIEAANQVTDRLEKARLRQAAIDQCNQEMMTLLERYGLGMDDLLPTESTGSQVIHQQNKKEATNSGLLELFGFKPKIKYKYITESLRR
jgi:hypothetical protein